MSSSSISRIMVNVGLFFISISILAILTLSTISSWFIRNDYWFSTFSQIGVQSEKVLVVGQLIEIGSLSNFEAGIFMSLILVALIPITFILIFFNRSSEPSLAEDYYSGPKLFLFREAIKHLNKSIKIIGKANGLLIHPMARLTSKLESANIFVYGMQGSGKSTLIKQWLLDIFKNKSDKCFIYDQKGEYETLLSSSNIACIAADNSSGYFWDIGLDVLTCEDAELVAESMIVSYHHSESDYFIDSARQVLLGVLFHLVQTNRPWSWSDIAKFLFSENLFLQSTLQASYISAAQFIEPNSKVTQSIRSVISSQLGWVSKMEKVNGQTPWSVSAWLNKDKLPLHVSFKPSPKSQAKSESMVNTLMSIITQQKLSEPDNEKEKTFLVIDELGNMPRSPSLESWLTLSRSKGGRMIAGTQSVDQIYKRYGTDSANSILSLFGIVVVMRLGISGVSAENASKSLGSYRIKVSNETITADEANSKSSSSDPRPVVTKEEIVHLPMSDEKGVEGYLVVGSISAVYKLKWPFPKKINIQKSEVREPNSLPLDNQDLNKEVVVKQNRLNRRRKKQTSKESKL
jgi:hypothetical protein